MGAKKQDPGLVSFLPFEDLKNMIDSRGAKISPSPQPAKEKVFSDEELFFDAMREVKEIREFRSIPYRRNKPVSARKSVSSESEALRAVEEIVCGKRPLNLPDTQEYVEWVHPSYKNDIIRKLREGRFSIQDCLDLHGLVLEEAEEEVARFLGEAMKRRLRCVKIIHGRGLRSPAGPVLKEALIRWLSFRYRKNTIAFVTARQCDGGLGALYVLLR